MDPEGALKICLTQLSSLTHSLSSYVSYRKAVFGVLLLFLCSLRWYKVTQKAKKKIFPSFCVTRHLHDGQESCHVGKKNDLFQGISYLNSSCIRKSITL